MIEVGDEVIYLGKEHNNVLAYKVKGISINSLGIRHILVDVPNGSLSNREDMFVLVSKANAQLQNNPIMEIGDLIVYIGISPLHGITRGMCVRVLDINFISNPDLIEVDYNGISIMGYKIQFCLLSKSSKNNTSLQSFNSVSASTDVSEKHFKLEKDFSITKKECECGAHKVGSNRHS